MVVLAVDTLRRLEHQHQHYLCLVIQMLIYTLIMKY